ncbi:MAG TPA: ferrochelatase [Saprospiraceae bacterium]|nr:ferrochelatase [Saprospiraceae bacterium]
MMAKRAILLANLGSPNSTDLKDVKAYLNEFLMDEKVIDIPYWIRYFLVKGIIVPLRAPKSAAKYKTIWTSNGSPLIHTTKLLTEAVEKTSGLPSYMCMRYANPTPLSVLAKMASDNPDLEEVVLMPLYPHYAMSSYETAVEHVKKAHQSSKYSFALKVIEPYYKNEDYIDVLSETIKPFLEKPYDHILFSYHGVPERHLKKTDPTHNHCMTSNDCCNTPSEAHKVCYRHQVMETTKAVAKKLVIPEDKYSLSFQSRLGSDKWLEPFTSKEFEDMPERGIKDLVVVCPAFVSDCLETLEEIWEEGKEEFEKSGGQHFTVVPCLNVHPKWVQTAVNMVNEVS